MTGLLELAGEIRAKRKRDGLSLREAGAASGVAFSTLGRIEAGAQPSYRVANLIQAWLSGKTSMLPTPTMTLRDWFAGQALANPAICTGSAPDYQLGVWFGKYATGITRPQIIARQAGEYADAMLRARATPSESSPT